LSRGFVKEDDLELAGTDMPERLISTHINYVTPLGLQMLEQQAKQLDTERAALLQNIDSAAATQSLAKVDRDLRYISARLENAVLVDPAQQPKTTVLFGATVVVEDENGQVLTYKLVGEDEADISQHKVSYVSPIAKALIGRKVGDFVLWQRPAGALNLEIIELHY
jgi:transcription elongation factor GreB